MSISKHSRFAVYAGLSLALIGTTPVPAFADHDVSDAATQSATDAATAALAAETPASPQENATTTTSATSDAATSAATPSSSRAAASTNAAAPAPQSAPTPQPAPAPAPAPAPKAQPFGYNGLKIMDEKGNDLTNKSIAAGTKLVITPQISGSTDGVTFNYVWQRNNSWADADWWSTMKGNKAAVGNSTYNISNNTIGTYTVYVDAFYKDAKGVTQKKTLSARVTLTEPKWGFSSVALTSDKGSSIKSVVSGAAINIAPKTWGDLNGAQYNYVWQRNGSWAKGEWGSTILSTGKTTTDANSTMHLYRAGTYTIYVDVISRTGKRQTLSTNIKITNPSWSAAGITLTNEQGKTVTNASVLSGTKVTITPHAKGDAAGMKFNYVWQRNGSWAQGEWDSTWNHTNKPVDESSHTFTFWRTGTYTIYVDYFSRSGEKRTSEVRVTVNERPWNFSGISATSGSSSVANKSVKVNKPIVISPKVSGDTYGMRYNYVWQRNNSWASSEWGSTIRSTGKTTSDKTWTFTPNRAGNYTLYIDCISSTGKKVTKSVNVNVVDSAWKFTGVKASASTVKVGTKISWNPQVSGTVDGATYNYVWQRNGSWASNDWGSTIRSTGKSTNSTSGSFTPSEPGIYTLYVDVMSKWGRKETKSVNIGVWGLAGVNAKQTGTYTWSISPNTGAPVPASAGVSYLYHYQLVGGHGANIGGWTSSTSVNFDVSANGRKEGYYDLSVTMKDKTGATVTKTTRVLYCPSGKLGWQNPSGYYQVSSRNVRLIPAAYNTPFSYVTPSRISINASRQDCINAFIQRAYEYLGTPYKWNYSRQPGVGVDCVGLVYQCAYATGMDLGDLNPYNHWYSGWNGYHSHDANNLWNTGKIRRIPLNQRQRGDLIFWPGHVAIYLGNDKIIEANGRDVHIKNMWAYGTPRGAAQLFVR